MGVVMFVFTMQSMWKFIDDIIGKGASVGMIIEFVFYLSLSLVPLALPAGILLASLYLMGNLSEKYELTSMKSAGISLWRILWPLIASCIIISIFSFICSNYIVPKANLKFRTRLYNFKSQKLALSLNEGIFNDDFKNYSIRIDEKNEETNDIKGIMLYDHSVENRNRTKIIMAEKGKINMESDERFMIMELDEGRQYQEMAEAKGTKPTDPRKYPYLRIKFDRLEKYLDLKEFEMKDTDEKIFKEQGTMMSLNQLIYEMDTMGQKMDEKRKYLSASVSSYFHFVKTSDSTSYYIPMAQTIDRKIETKVTSQKNKYRSSNSSKKAIEQVEKAKKSSKDWRSKNIPESKLERPKKLNNGGGDTPKKLPPPKLERPKKLQGKELGGKTGKKDKPAIPKAPNPKNVSPPIPSPNKKQMASRAEAEAKAKAKAKVNNNKSVRDKIINETKLNGKPESFEEVMMPRHRENMRDRAAAATKAIKDKGESNILKIANLQAKQNKYNYEIHLKFSLAAACLVFLFIGAPLGAIIRKGGFGYPILVGVLLFVIFVALVTVFKKLGESDTLSSPMAAWIPVFIFFVPCFFLTIGAVRDAKVMNMDAMEAWFKRLRIVKFIVRG